MKKIITLIFGIAFILGCTSNNNSNIDNTPPVNSYSYSQGVNITDVDGNSYPTIVTNCNNQTWMQKNLNVSHYRNGDVIPQVTNPGQWRTLTSGAWCYYNDDSANGPIYGKLYNWYAVNDPRGLAPQGWHIPTNQEWTALTDCLGGESNAGGKMKGTGTTYWLTPNYGATNSSGFTALPIGFRWWQNGYFSGYSNSGSTFWSSTQYDNDNGWQRGLNYNTTEVYSSNSNNYNKKCGLSIRCLKD
jgi:uncharacterized protein (TIGR02145 family)